MNFALLLTFKLTLLWLYFGKSCKTTLFRKSTEIKMGGRTCYFLIFAFSLFPNFKWLSSKILYWISSVYRKFYYVTNIFDLHIFDKETVALLNFLEICIKKHFVSSFFLNEKSITTSLLMIHLKYTIVHYSNLNSSSISKPFLNYGPLNMLFFFSFFYNFLFTFILTRLLSKKL